MLLTQVAKATTAKQLSDLVKANFIFKILGVNVHRNN